MSHRFEYTSKVVNCTFFVYFCDSNISIKFIQSLISEHVLDFFFLVVVWGLFVFGVLFNLKEAILTCKIP